MPELAKGPASKAEGGLPAMRVRVPLPPPYILTCLNFLHKAE